LTATNTIITYSLNPEIKFCQFSFLGISTGQQGVNVFKNFFTAFDVTANKLECLLLATVFGLHKVYSAKAWSLDLLPNI
jgi:hypothetical protein